METAPAGPYRPARNLRTRLRRDQGGASAVEFSIISIIVFALAFGTFNGALAWNTKQQLTHAVRDGARYGGTLPTPDQSPDVTCWESGASWTPGSDCWTDVVLERTVEAGITELDSSVYADRYVCVAYVVSNTSSTNNHSMSDGPTPPGGVPAEDTAMQRCYTDDRPDGEARVQVVAARPYDFEVIIVSPFTITLPAVAVARHEGSAP